jgi:hypothetical protein
MVVALSILATVSLMPTTAGASQDSPVGRWLLRVEWPNAPSDVTLTVNEADGVLAAVWEGRQGTLEASEVTFENGVLSFVLAVEDQSRRSVELRYRGSIDGDRIAGSITLPIGTEIVANGERVR